MTRGAAPRSLFALGFRPFFLLAGLVAVGAMALWLAALHGEWTPPRLPPTVWHAHEMLFGYTVAVIAGFLLTAVRNWTGVPTPTGGALALLALVWTAGRIALAIPGIPGWAAGGVALAFLPLLALAVGRSLVRAGNRRNYGMLVLLGLLWAAQIGVFTGDAEVQRRALYAGLHVVVLFIVVIGGRVIPMFTGNAVGVATRRAPRLDWAAFAAVAAYAVTHAAGGPPGLLGALAAAAAVFNAARMRGWAGLASRRVPILFILHAGYVWVPLGFALAALAAYTPWVPVTAATHALTLGAVGTLTLGMMARVALGHTGRPIHARPAVVAAYVLLGLAAAVRALGPLTPASLVWVWTLAGTLWMAAFAIFVVVYVPILTAPRADGRPG